MRFFLMNAKNSKIVNNIVQQKYHDSIIKNFIKDKNIKTINKSAFSWTIPKEKRVLKNYHQH